MLYIKQLLSAAWRLVVCERRLEKPGF